MIEGPDRRGSATPTCWPSRPGLQGDARMAGLKAEAARLVAHGATRLRRHEPAPRLGAGHIVMADPEGNEFCLD